MIEGVVVQKLRQIVDDRGKVMHMLRCDSPLFESFGEIYFSTVKYRAIKAWKLHKEMTLNLAVLTGQAKVVLYDGRPDSLTKGQVQEILLGGENYCLLKIPAGIWNGFQGIAQQETMLANCATLPHDSQECDRMDPFDKRIPYLWNQGEQQ